MDREEIKELRERAKRGELRAEDAKLVEALALYLLLVTVADAEGLSCYSDPTAGRLLNMDESSLAKARCELCRTGLPGDHSLYLWLPYSFTDDHLRSRLSAAKPE